MSDILYHLQSSSAFKIWKAAPGVGSVRKAESSLRFPSSIPPLFSLFSCLLSQDLETTGDRKLDKEMQLRSKEKSSIQSRFHHIESEKTQEALVLIKLILENSDADELIRVGY